MPDFTDNVGIPKQLITDEATEFTGWHTEFVKEARRMCIMLNATEQGRKNQNHTAECEIGFFDGSYAIPKHLWDFRLVYESELLSHMMARGNDS
jgi:hypothetical protein